MEPARVIGIDLGGTQVRAALVEGSTVLRRAAMPTDSAGGPLAVMDQIDSLVGDVTSGFDLSAVAGVGISSAGPLDSDAGVILGIPTLPGWEAFPLREAVATRLGRPVLLENDAIAAVFGEWRHGAGRGLRHLVYLTVSTGIGGGVVVDGRLVRGRMGMAAHVGHIRLAQQGPRCACGATGCLEALASGTALGQRGRAEASGDPDGFLGRAARFRPVAAVDVFEGARAGDPACRALVDEEARHLGQGITAIIHCYSPERVVIGGGVSKAFDILEAGILAVIRADALPPFRDVRVVRGELGDNAGLVGAAAMALDRFTVSP